MTVGPYPVFRIQQTEENTKAELEIKTLLVVFGDGTVGAFIPISDSIPRLAAITIYMEKYIQLI